MSLHSMRSVGYAYYVFIISSCSDVPC